MAKRDKHIFKQSNQKGEKKDEYEQVCEQIKRMRKVQQSNGVNKKIQIIYNKPKWHNLSGNDKQKKGGKLLIGYALIQEQDKMWFNHNQQDIKPRFNTQDMQLFCIGLRDLEVRQKDKGRDRMDVCFQLDSPRPQHNHPQVIDEPIDTHNRSLNINKHIPLSLDIPNNKSLSPILDILVYTLSQNSNNRNLFALGQLPLNNHLHKFAIKKNNNLLQNTNQEDDDNDNDEDYSEDDNLLTFSSPEQKIQQNKQFSEYSIENMPIPNELPMKIISNKEQSILKKSKVNQQQLENIEEIEDEDEDNSQSYTQSYIDFKSEKDLDESKIRLGFIANRNDDEQQSEQKSEQSSVEIKKTDFKQNSISKVNNKISQMSQISQRTEKEVLKQIKSKNNSKDKKKRIQFIDLEEQFSPITIKKQSQIADLPNISIIEKQSINIALNKTKSIYKQYPENQSIQQQQEQHPLVLKINQSVQQQSKLNRTLNSLNSTKRKKKLNQTLIEVQDNQSFNKIIKQNSKLLGLTKKGIDSLDDEFRNSYNYQHKGMPKIQPSRNTLKSVRKQERGIKINNENIQISENDLSSLSELESNNIDEESIQQGIFRSKLWDQISIKNKLEKGSIKKLDVDSDTSIEEASIINSTGIGIQSVQRNSSLAHEIIPLNNNNNQQQNESQKQVNSRILSLMTNGFSLVKTLFEKKKTIINYEDFDSEDSEDLDLSPEWLRNRQVYKCELEQCMQMNSDIVRVELKRAGQDKEEEEDQDNMGYFKCIILQNTSEESLLKKVENIKSLMSPRKFIANVHLLELANLGSVDETAYYLQVSLGGHILIGQSYKSNNSVLQIYEQFIIEVQVPGAAVLIISLMTKENKCLGKAKIDLEDRYFSANWRKQVLKPIEVRTLKGHYNKSIGQLRMWADLQDNNVENNENKNRVIAMERPMRMEFELRCIIYETREVTLKDLLEKCNDLFVRGYPGTLAHQDTDTHWRCRDRGSFNWRMKFNLQFPLRGEQDYGTDRMFIQLLDKDLIGSDEMIGEAILDLNTHRMIAKACKRDKAVEMRMRMPDQGGEVTNQIWLDVYHPKQIDPEGKYISQGQVKIALELLPLATALTKPNALGRDIPNNFPVLDPPTGRFSFDFLKPFQTFNAIFGPTVARRIKLCICCVIFTILIIYLIWTLLTQGIVVAIAQ